MSVIVFVGVLTSGACGGSTATTAIATPTSATAPAPIFQLGEITVFEGATAMIKIHANGTTELGGHQGRLELTPGKTMSTDALPVVWKAGPTLAPDGTIVAKGNPVARLAADGSVHDLVRGDVIPLTVTDDEVTFPSKAGIRLAPDGTVTLIDGHAPVDRMPRVEGADTAGKRRAVLMLLGLTFGGGGAPTVETSESVSP